MRNVIDIHTSETDDGRFFIIILDCLDPENCIPVNHDPETDDDVLNVFNSHAILELFDFFEDMLTVKHESGEYFRAFRTIEINKNNVGSFIENLSLIDDYWAEVDEEIEIEEDYKKKTAGKNVVEGNGTVN